MLLTARMVSAGPEAGSSGAALMGISTGGNLRRRAPPRGGGRRWRAGARRDGSKPPLSRPPGLPRGGALSFGSLVRFPSASASRRSSVPLLHERRPVAVVVGALSLRSLVAGFRPLRP